MLTDARFPRSCLVAVGLLAVAGCQKAAPPPPPPKLVEVDYVCPVEQALTEREEFSGRTWSPETVEIRARVSGYLDDAIVKDGADVDVGDVLFEIEDDTFQAELRRTEAAVEQAKAQYDRLKSQLERSRKLLATRAVSTEQFETLTFQTSEAEAAHAAAQAARDLAKLNVGFTKVKSPIKGRIGRRLVDPGNLVEADETPLANIVSLDPIYAYFDFDERSILRMRTLVEEGRLKEAPTRETDAVDIALAGSDGFSLHGTINWVDNQIDPGTGTLRARVQIDNPKLLLSPGMFVRLRVPVSAEETALVIPEEALGSDQGLRYVYVIGPEDKIQRRDIQIGWLAGNMRVVTSGLSRGDRVAVTNLQKIGPGKQVIAKDRPAKKLEKEATAITSK